MRFSSVALASAVLPGLALSTPLAPRSPPKSNGNPFLNRVSYINSGYSAKIQATIDSFTAKGDLVNAARARTVQKKVSSFLWISFVRDIEPFKKHLDEAIRVQRRPPNKKLIVPVVIYNLPDRDCSAKASDGEFKLDDDGLNKYKAYIDQIVKVIDSPPNDRLDFAIVLEPDSLANLVTNLSVEKCRGAAQAYKEGIAYAIKKLQRKNVSLYIDGAHTGWLGWPDNLEPSADIYKEVLELAGKGAKIRGFATNVSNYNKYDDPVPDNIYKDHPNFNEKLYVNALAPYLKARGIPAHFIIDQGRAGQKNIKEVGGRWCNIADSGFGTLPTTDTGDELVDSIVWVKPGGESDGTSDPSSHRFDENCVSPDAKIPAPEAGDWFNEFVEDLVVNANPVLEETYE